MRTYIGLVLIAAIFTLAGCDTTTVAPLDGEYSESTLNAQGELLHASEFNEESKSSDEELYELAQDIVDFGGFYFDNGSPVMYLKEPGNRNAILAAIRAKTVSSGTDVLSTLNRASGRSDLRILKADFGFSELYQWREAAFSVLHATDGVLSFDVNEKENRVVIGIESPTLEKQLSERLDQAGIPTHGIVFEEGQRVEDLSLRAKHRPAFGGLQIQYRDAGFTWNCSAGPVVMHWYNSKWNYGFLTAAHCTGNRHAVTGVDYYQHTYPSSSNFIGEEYEEMPFDASVNGFWGDVAFVETEPGIELYNRVGRTVLWTSACSSTSSDCPTDSSNPHFTVQGTYSSAWMGVTLNKSGRTTGWTDGTVSNTCIDVQGGTVHGTGAVLKSSVLQGEALE